MSNEGAGREYRDGKGGFYTDEMRVGRLFKKVTGDDPEPPFHEAGLGRLKVCGQLTTAYTTVPTRPKLLQYSTRESRSFHGIDETGVLLLVLTVASGRPFFVVPYGIGL